jgi:uncharacterized membrane protein YkvA (DUF1232 family)
MQRLRQAWQRFRAELDFWRRVWRHPRTPRAARWLLGLALAYAVTPFDIIPDFIPVLGHLDDLVIVPALVALAAWLVPRDVLAECRSALAPAPPAA